MLPVVLYNMEGSSNSLNNTPNNSFGQYYDENLILNSVRSRKKVTELSNCPVCSCTIRHGELESHLSIEVERLQKLSCASSKRKLSGNSSGSGSSFAVPGSSTSPDVREDQDVDVSGCPGADVYQRVNTNRLRRLRARRRGTPPPTHGECPVCNASMPTARLQRHALRCLKRTGAEMDEDVSDTSSEDGSIDVENDEPSGGSFGAEYQWCGRWRVRASALAAARPGTALRRASHDQTLVVDGDEDTELYGPPQYSPSRIAPEDTTGVQMDSASTEDPSMECPANGVSGQPCTSGSILKPSELVEASAETRVQALKAKIKELISVEVKCLICLGPYTSPAVSIQCWHVYCEECWLQSLRAKKICPQCNAITTTEHLRRIYM